MDEEKLNLMLNDAELLLDELDRALEEADPRELPLNFLSSKKGKNYREVKDGAPYHNLVESLLQRFDNQLVILICDEFQYCKKKKKYGPTIDLIKAVHDTLLSTSFSMPIPLATVAVYCVQSLYLDKKCQCDHA